MAFREVPMFEVREVLRLWLGGEGLRGVARLSRVDRKTVRRYVDAAIEAGVTVDGGVGQLTDLALGMVVEIVRPHRSDGHGEAWSTLADRRDKVEAWVTAGVAGVKICELLARDGISVPERTVQRFIATEFGPRRGQGSTVRIADGEPGHELLCGTLHNVSYVESGTMWTSSSSGESWPGRWGWPRSGGVA